MVPCGRGPRSEGAWESQFWAPSWGLAARGLAAASRQSPHGTDTVGLRLTPCPTRTPVILDWGHPPPE